MWIEGFRNHRVRLRRSVRGHGRLGALAWTALLALSTAPAAWAQATPLHVVTTVGMIGDLVTELTGPCARVDVLMGPGVDPHLYRATPSDVRALGNADLVLYVGLGLEGQLGEVLASFGRRTPTVAVGDVAIPAGRLLATSYGDGTDPHAWMDVSAWATTVPVLVEAITAAGPACTDVVLDRAPRLAAELAALDAWIAAAVATVPPSQRVLVTAHDAFEYYGRAYGLSVASIQGVSTDAEPSIADVRETARLVADAGVPALFVETTIHPRTVQAVLDAASALGAQVTLGGTLYSDAMGEPGTAEGTYVGMLYANTVHIVTALGGDVPPLPGELVDWARRYGVDTGTP